MTSFTDISYTLNYLHIQTVLITYICVHHKFKYHETTARDQNTNVKPKNKYTYVVRCHGGRWRLMPQQAGARQAPLPAVRQQPSLSARKGPSRGQGRSRRRGEAGAVAGGEAGAVAGGEAGAIAGGEAGAFAWARRGPSPVAWRGPTQRRMLQRIKQS